MIRKDNMVHPDIAPATRRGIHNPQASGLALILPDHEGLARHDVLILPCQLGHNFVANQELQRDAFCIRAPADQGVDVAPVDRKGLGGHHADVSIPLAGTLPLAGVMGVHQPFALRAHLPLVFGQFGCKHRPLAEGCAFHRPVLVRLRFKILEHHIRPGFGSRPLSICDDRIVHIRGPVAAAKDVHKLGSTIRPGMLKDGIGQATRQSDFNRCRRCIPHSVAHHRQRQ